MITNDGINAIPSDEEIANELSELEKYLDGVKTKSKNFFIVENISGSVVIEGLFANSGTELINDIATDSRYSQFFHNSRDYNSELEETGSVEIYNGAGGFLATYTDFSQAEKKAQELAKQSSLKIDYIDIKIEEIIEMTKKDKKNSAVAVIEEEVTTTEDIEDIEEDENETPSEEAEAVETSDNDSSDNDSTDEVSVEEACAIVHRQAMWVKKQCREKLEKESNARKEGGQWLIKRARLEELSEEIEVYNVTLEDAAKKIGLSEDEVTDLINAGKVKASDTDDGLRISKKSLNYYQKEIAEPAETVEG